jgi:hypothetical protein
LKVLKITEEVYQYYRENVKGNQNTSRDQAARKLTRNIKCADKVPRKFNEMFDSFREYWYGNLYILVHRGTVVQIRNHKGRSLHGWQLDNAKYHKLTKRLGIVE